MPVEIPVPIPAPGAGTVNIPLPSIPLPSIPGASAVADITGQLAAARAWVSNRHNWVRMAWVASGLVLVVAGVIVMAGEPVRDAAPKIVETAAKVAT
jgi:hypothetical protein